MNNLHVYDLSHEACVALALSGYLKEAGAESLEEKAIVELGSTLNKFFDLWRTLRVHVDQYPEHIELKADRDSLRADVAVLEEQLKRRHERLVATDAENERLKAQLYSALNTIEFARLSLQLLAANRNPVLRQEFDPALVREALEAHKAHSEECLKAAQGQTAANPMATVARFTNAMERLIAADEANKSPTTTEVIQCKKI